MALAAPAETVLYNFAGSPSDGGLPLASLVFDRMGALYGTTSGGGTTGNGTVFKLTPPPNGMTGWIETVLYSFEGGAGDGAVPEAGLTFDAAGNLYGTTTGGGTTNSGTVFKLTPPASGVTVWTENVLYSFKNSGDGLAPFGSVIFDTSGALYGTTSAGGTAGNGTVFKLTPPANGTATWTETVLYSFQGGASDGAHPQAGLVFDNTGALYGTTINDGNTNCAAFGTCGTVFKLAPPADGMNGWTETLLHSFTGTPTDGGYAQGSLVFDTNGALYGTTAFGGISNVGTVFKLTPPTSGITAWTETVLTSFTGQGSNGNGAFPRGALIFDAAGALYGTTANGGMNSTNGTVFELTPPANGTGTWNETVIYNFPQSGNNGSAPFAALVNDTSGILYGTTFEGGSHDDCTAPILNVVVDCGTVFEITGSGFVVPILLSPSEVAATASGLAYSRVSRTFNGTLTITNISSSPINGPFQIRLTRLTLGVTLANATGDFSGSPYLTVPAIASLAAGQSATVSVQFNNPSFGPINFTPMVYSGSI